MSVPGKTQTSLLVDKTSSLGRNTYLELNAWKDTAKKWKGLDPALGPCSSCQEKVRMYCPRASARFWVQCSSEYMASFHWRFSLPWAPSASLAIKRGETPDQVVTFLSPALNTQVGRQQAWCLQMEETKKPCVCQEDGDDMDMNSYRQEGHGPAQAYQREPQVTTSGDYDDYDLS